MGDDAQRLGIEGDVGEGQAVDLRVDLDAVLALLEVGNHGRDLLARIGGDRLLISLAVHAKEKSILSFGADATLQIWGRPVLDQAQQTLRLADIQLAVESEAAFGLLGAAARAVVPQMQQALVQKATVDLKPIAANAREKIAAAIADFQKSEDGVKVEAKIDSLTLADIAFDSKTLRVIAEAGGSLNVSVTKLSGM